MAGINTQTLKKTIQINYAPDFRVRYGPEKMPVTYINRIFEHHDQAQDRFVDDLVSLRGNLEKISIFAEEDDPQPRWIQPWFPPLDGATIYGMTALSKPKRVIEIGSGNSTKFLRRAIQDHSLECILTSIDPQPRAEVDAIIDHVIRNRLEDADLSIFQDLEPKDIVFFDGSHRCFQNSDVTTFFIEVLPSLKPGVIIGIHDIFWPFDYPEKWIDRYYSEQYVLGAYMMALGTNFPLIFSCAYGGGRFAKKIRDCVSPEIIIELGKNKMGLGGGAIWFHKPATPF